MLIIAENLNIRNGRYMNALRKFSPDTIRQLAGELIDAGANAQALAWLGDRPELARAAAWLASPAPIRSQ